MEYALQLTLQIVLFVVLIVSAYTDITRNKVYNWCTLPGIGVGLALSYLIGGLDGPGVNLINSLLGLLVGGGIFFAAALWGGIGFGDVKLMGAVGALTGFQLTLHSLFYSTLVGFVIAVGYLVWQERLWSGLKSSLRFAFTLKGRRELLEKVRGGPAPDGAAASASPGDEPAPSPGVESACGPEGASGTAEEKPDATEEKPDAAEKEPDAQEGKPPEVEETGLSRKHTIPFGTAIAIGTFWAWFLQF